DEDRTVEITVQLGQQVAEGQRQEQTGQRRRRPERAPQPFPGKRDPCQPQTACKIQAPPARGVLASSGVVRSRGGLRQALLTSRGADDPAQSYHGSSAAP